MTTVDRSLMVALQGAALAAGRLDTALERCPAPLAAAWRFRAAISAGATAMASAGAAVAEDRLALAVARARSGGTLPAAVKLPAQGDGRVLLQALAVVEQLSRSAVPEDLQGGLGQEPEDRLCSATGEMIDWLARVDGQEQPLQLVLLAERLAELAGEEAAPDLVSRLAVPLALPEAFRIAAKVRSPMVCVATAWRGHGHRGVGSMLAAVTDALAAGHDRLRALERTWKSLARLIQGRVRRPGSSVLPRLVPLLVTLPVVTSGAVAEAAGCTRRAAAWLLAGLAEDGVVTELTGHSRAKAYAVADLGQVFSGLLDTAAPDRRVSDLELLAELAEDHRAPLRAGVPGARVALAEIDDAALQSLFNGVDRLNRRVGSLVAPLRPAIPGSTSDDSRS